MYFLDNSVMHSILASSTNSKNSFNKFPENVTVFKGLKHPFSSCPFGPPLDPRVLFSKRCTKKSLNFFIQRCSAILHIFFHHPTYSCHTYFLRTDLIFNFPESVLTRKKVILVKSIQTVRISFNLKAVRICAKVITGTLFNCNNNLPLMSAITRKV